MMVDVVQRLHQATQVVTTALERVMAIGDRALGPAPPSEGTSHQEAAQAGPASARTELLVGLARLERAARVLHGELDRLEGFV